MRVDPREGEETREGSVKGPTSVFRKDLPCRHTRTRSMDCDTRVVEVTLPYRHSRSTLLHPFRESCSGPYTSDKSNRTHLEKFS